MQIVMVIAWLLFAGTACAAMVITAKDKMRKERFGETRDVLFDIVLREIRAETEDGEVHGHILLPQYKAIPDHDAETKQNCYRFTQMLDDGRKRDIYITEDGQHIYKLPWKER